MFQDFPLFPQSASQLSGRVDGVFLFTIGICAFFALLITVLIIVFSVRYRRRRNAVATQVHGSLALEIFWTAVPLGLAMAIFYLGADLYFANARAPRDATDVYVTAKQWMWRVQHTDGQREINALHVPIGQPIKLTMTSEDVIHSFFVPAFRTKADVLPGRYTTVWFEATRVGVYHLFCAEYCGTKHSEMIGSVYVMEPAEYQQWLSGAPAGETPVQMGQRLFGELRCDTCHTSGPDARGPLLDGQFGTTVQLESGGRATFDEEYVRQSILEPNARIVRGFQPLMPTFTGQVGEEQILALIAYIKSLSEE